MRSTVRLFGRFMSLSRGSREVMSCDPEAVWLVPL
jgi:hypothetical protein